MEWTIKHNGKRMYLDYETDNLFEARFLIRAYLRNNVEFYVRKNCSGIYGIYCERIFLNPVGYVDFG